MKSEIKILCDKINNEVEKELTSPTFSSLVEGLNATAIKRIILNASDIAEHKPNDSDYQYEFTYAISTVLKLSNKSTLRDIINKLNEDNINRLEKLLDKRRKAIILYAFIEMRNSLIKQYNATGNEFNIYDINYKFDNICNAYVSDPKYDTPEHTWQDLDMLTTGPIFGINENTFGRNGKFKKIFDNIEDIIKRNKT